MTEAADLVRALYRAYQDRDWDRATALFHPDVVVVMPATAERLVGRPAVVSFQRSYPEPWGTMSVRRVLTDAEGAVAELLVEAPSGPDSAVAAFWRTREGLLSEGVEYWVDIGAGVPGAHRAALPDTQAARRAWEA